MVFYLKYRPQKIEELDSENIRNRLYSVLSGKTVSHAFLFTGPKGLGKTSTARIVAKALNCEKKKVIEPCNKCSQCVSITNGTNMDILEIDGASNRGIDEIRDLREKIKLLPLRASKKVYIIDEVHMLTTEAFNALLKTLEEPPSHAVFILCTTEPQKVPATILSRCFHISFKKATKDELLHSFARIAKSEKIVLEKEALDCIASLSDGSFRDGVKILEEILITSDGKKVTKEMVEKRYQVSGIRFQVSGLLEHLEKRDTKKAFLLISEVVEKGTDLKYFLEKIVDDLHSQVLKNIGIEKEDYQKNTTFTISELKNLIELFTKAHSELKYAVLPQLPLELAIIEWGTNQTNQDAGRLPHVANDAQRALDKDSSLSSSSLSESRLPKPDKILNEKPGSAFNSFASGQAPRKPLNQNMDIKDNNQPEIFEKVDVWKELIARVKPYNHSVAGVLRGCSLKNFDGEKLVIETGYKFHKERLENRKVLEIIEKVIREINGKKVDVSILLKRG
ncbi:MAG: DNA polymerase III subunit gamma/tau [Candidatus Levybacteria bacterium]|nr:DNA polymerase III subunit gamma/tau [Candidatus Levybacteria bacterium]